jgi:hypothetical protein
VTHMAFLMWHNYECYKLFITSAQINIKVIYRITVFFLPMIWFSKGLVIWVSCFWRTRQSRCLPPFTWGRKQFQCTIRVVYVSVHRYVMGSRGSAVDTVTGCELGDWRARVWVPVGTKNFFSSPRRPDRFWAPPSLLSNGYRKLFPWW